MKNRENDIVQTYLMFLTLSFIIVQFTFIKFNNTAPRIGFAERILPRYA